MTKLTKSERETFEEIGAASHSEAMTSPLAPVRPDISQGVVRAGNVTYTLTETRSEKPTRLWSRPKDYEKWRSEK